MTLTEQWKKGELDRGIYYIKEQGFYKTDEWHGKRWEDSWNENIEEVIAPVPSYEEWQDTENRSLLTAEFSNEIDELNEENQRLKELLKECREKLKYCVRETYELQTKIDEVLK